MTEEQSKNIEPDPVLENSAGNNLYSSKNKTSLLVDLTVAFLLSVLVFYAFFSFNENLYTQYHFKSPDWIVLSFKLYGIFYFIPLLIPYLGIFFLLGGEDATIDFLYHAIISLLWCAVFILILRFKVKRKSIRYVVVVLLALFMSIPPLYATNATITVSIDKIARSCVTNHESGIVDGVCYRKIVEVNEEVNKPNVLESIDFCVNSLDKYDVDNLVVNVYGKNLGDPRLYCIDETATSFLSGFNDKRERKRGDLEEYFVEYEPELMESIKDYKNGNIPSGIPTLHFWADTKLAFCEYYGEILPNKKEECIEYFENINEKNFTKYTESSYISDYNSKSNVINTIKNNPHIVMEIDTNIDLVNESFIKSYNNLVERIVDSSDLSVDEIIIKNLEVIYPKTQLDLNNFVEMFFPSNSTITKGNVTFDGQGGSLHNHRSRIHMEATESSYSYITGSVYLKNKPKYVVFDAVFSGKGESILGVYTGGGLDKNYLVDQRFDNYIDRLYIVPIKSEVLTGLSFRLDEYTESNTVVDINTVSFAYENDVATIKDMKPIGYKVGISFGESNYVYYFDEIGFSSITDKY